MATKRTSQWVRALASAVVGFGAGTVFGGGGFVRTYDWKTEWHIDAPLPDVYHAMTALTVQYSWWTGMIVKRVTPIPGSSEGHILEGEIHQTGSPGRLAPPFQLVSRITALEQDRRMRSIVSGTLVGVMETFFYPREEGGRASSSTGMCVSITRCSMPWARSSNHHFGPVMTVSCVMAKRACRPTVSSAYW